MLQTQRMCKKHWGNRTCINNCSQEAGADTSDVVAACEGCQAASSYNEAHLVVAGKVEKLMCVELNVYWVWVCLQHRP